MVRDDLRQALARHRFAHERIEAGGERLRFGLGIGAGGDRDHRSVEARRAQLAREREAVHAGQVEIEQREIETPRRLRGQRRERMRRMHDAMALRLQVLPLLHRERRLVMAMNDPTRRATLEELEFITQNKVAPVLADTKSLEDAIRSAYERIRAARGLG